MKKIKNFEELTLSSSDSIFKAMKKINDGKFRFQIIMGKNLNFIGTITDGDIRRGLLRGLELTSEISECMNKSPIIAFEKEYEKHENIFKSIPSTIKFLPVLKNNKKLNYVLIDEKLNLNKTALIMAGGFGSRLGEKTRNIPKPLLRINNKPILEILLKKLEDASYETIYISAYYLHKKIEEFIKNRNSRSKIKLIIEDKPLGTAGSINLVSKNDYDTLTVINGDVVTDVNFNALVEFHDERKNDITITVTKYEYKVPFGVINLTDNYNLKDIKEKPTFRHNILSGIYCLEKNVCELVGQETIDMPEILIRGSKLGKKIEVFPIYEYWKDLGTPEDFKL